MPYPGLKRPPASCAHPRLRYCARRLLQVGRRSPAGKRTYALHQGRALGDGDNATGVHQVEQVRALQAVIVSGQDGVALDGLRRTATGFTAILPAVEKLSGFLLVKFEFRAQSLGVAAIEAVFRELLLFGEADVGVRLVGGPANLIDAFDVLQKGADALEAVGNFHGDRVKVDATALLEVGELGDFEAVQQYLPTDAPGTEGGGFPVVFLEADVVLAQVDANGAEAAQVDVLNVRGRRF